MQNPKFVKKKDSAGKFRFTLHAANGQVILQSEAYNSVASCDNGIESVRKNSTDEGRFERKMAKNGKPYFVLKAGNGQVIGQSQMYASANSMENGVKSVKKNGPVAPVDDQIS